MVDIFSDEYWEQYGIKDYDKLHEYLNIMKSIQNMGERDLDDHAWHHIVPKSFDSSVRYLNENYVRLTNLEHYRAHRFLAEVVSGDYASKTSLAAHYIIHGSNLKYTLSEDEISQVSGVIAEAFSEKYSGENNPFYGKTHTEESRSKISNRRRAYFANMTDEEREEYCNSKRRENLSEQALINMSNGQKGNKNRLGKPTSDETKKKISEILSDGRMKGKNVGRKLESKYWVNNGEHDIRIKEEELDYYISIGYKRGRLRFPLTGRKAVHKEDGAYKYVKIEDLQYYLDNGWEEGRR